MAPSIGLAPIVLNNFANARSVARNPEGAKIPFDPGVLKRV
jgi:hypothetical protein